MFDKKTTTVCIAIFSIFITCFADKEKDSIEDAFQKIDNPGENKYITREFLDKSFDLNDNEISDFMLKKMIWNSYRGSKPDGVEVMRCINQLDPEKGVSWLLSHYNDLSPIGRFNMIDALSPLEYKEIYQLILSLSNDKSILEKRGVPSLTFQARLKPRVCDYVYANICLKIHSYDLEKYDKWWSGKETLDGFPSTLGVSTPYKIRDDYINRLKKWWEENSEKGILKDKPSISEKYPELGKKIEAFIIKMNSLSSSKKDKIDQKIEPHPKR